MSLKIEVTTSSDTFHQMQIQSLPLGESSPPKQHLWHPQVYPCFMLTIYSSHLCLRLLVKPLRILKAKPQGLHLLIEASLPVISHYSCSFSHMPPFIHDSLYVIVWNLDSVKIHIYCFPVPGPLLHFYFSTSKDGLE